MKATRIAERIWIPQSCQSIHLFGKLFIKIPNRKAGPALLENASILSASALDMCPFSHSSDTAFAPTGYPLRMPVRKIPTEPGEIPMTLPIGLHIGKADTRMAVVSMLDSTKNGKIDGIMLCKHRSAADCPAIRAVLESRISKSNPRPAKIPFMYRLPIQFTSQESMRQMAISSMEKHILLQKEEGQ